MTGRQMWGDWEVGLHRNRKRTVLIEQQGDLLVDIKEKLNEEEIHKRIIRKQKADSSLHREQVQK